MLCLTYLQCVLISTLEMSQAVVPRFYGNIQLSGGDIKIKGLRVSSLQNCLHRCKLHETCQVINFKSEKTSDNNCLFYAKDLFDKTPKSSYIQSSSWHLYSLSSNEVRCPLFYVSVPPLLICYHCPPSLLQGVLPEDEGVQMKCT